MKSVVATAMWTVLLASRTSVRAFHSNASAGSFAAFITEGRRARSTLATKALLEGVRIRPAVGLRGGSSDADPDFDCDYLVIGADSGGIGGPPRTEPNMAGFSCGFGFRYVVCGGMEGELSGGEA